MVEQLAHRDQLLNGHLEDDRVVNGIDILLVTKGTNLLNKVRNSGLQCLRLVVRKDRF